MISILIPSLRQAKPKCGPVQPCIGWERRKKAQGSRNRNRLRVHVSHACNAAKAQVTTQATASEGQKSCGSAMHHLPRRESRVMAACKIERPWNRSMQCTHTSVQRHYSFGVAPSLHWHALRLAALEKSPYLRELLGQA